MKTLSEVWGETLKAILISPNHEFSPVKGEVLADEVLFLVGNNCIRVTPVVETDEIEFEVISQLETHLGFQPVLEEYFGKSMSMFWTCRNSNGYLDMIVFGFADLHPQVIVLSEGSVLKFFEVSPVTSFPIDDVVRIEL